MFLELAQKMRHIGQLESTTSISSGGLFPDMGSVTTLVTVNCYCYQDDEDAAQTIPAAQAGYRRWNAILLSRYRAQCVVGAILKDVYDQFGNVVIWQGQARVEDVITFRHWESGQEFIQLLLRPNA